MMAVPERSLAETAYDKLKARSSTSRCCRATGSRDGDRAAARDEPHAGARGALSARARRLSHRAPAGGLERAAVRLPAVRGLLRPAPDPGARLGLAALRHAGARRARGLKADLARLAQERLHRRRVECRSARRGVPHRRSWRPPAIPRSRAAIARSPSASASSGASTSRRRIVSTRLTTSTRRSCARSSAAARRRRPRLLRSHVESSKAEVRKITLHRLSTARHHGRRPSAGSAAPQHDPVTIRGHTLGLPRIRPIHALSVDRESLRLVRRQPRARSREPGRRARRDDRAARQLRLRQDHAVALDRRLRDARRGQHQGGGRGHHASAAGKTRDGDDVPILCAVAAHDRRGQHRLRAAHARMEARGDRPAHRARC